MRLSWRIDTVLLLASLFWLLEFTVAHSQRRNRVTYISRVDNAVINTPSHKAHAHSSFDIIFALHNGAQDVKFTLEPNHDIIPQGATIEYLDENGNVEKTEELVRQDYKVYKGNSWLRDDKGWTYAGWARIVISKDGVNPMFEGAFTLNHDAHHLHSRSNYLRTRHAEDPLIDEDGDDYMLVWRDSDVERTQLRTQRDDGLVARGEAIVVENGVMCPSDNLTFNTQSAHPINKMIMKKPGMWGSFGLDDLLGGGRAALERRQQTDIPPGGTGNSAVSNLRNYIGSTDGCPKTRLVALVGVATDCTYTGDFPSEQDARTNIIRQFNSASDLYERTFNVTLGLSQLVISKANCPGTAPEGAKWNVPCSNSLSINNRLSIFSEWRGQRANDSLALWTLLTTCETGSAVGVAWLGQLCVTDASAKDASGDTVSGANVVAKTDTEWKVIAHEIGHTMGAVHDCTPETCVGSAATASMCCPFSTTTCDAGGDFIMNTVTNTRSQEFSPCTIGNICTAWKMKGVDTTCLTQNRGVTVITEQACGNGIVEAGEDCDCGGEGGCGTNACCDAKTCKFKNNAVCDDSNEDCCFGCQFAGADRVCRASNGECDPEEKCTGTSPTCPKDEVLKDGSNCGNGLQCASGQCTSRDAQCQSVMGAISSNNDTRSCDSSDCVLSCQSPELGADLCMRIGQNFLNGTPCRGDGLCKNGVCSGASALGEVKSWVDRHKNIVIGVGAGIGAILLFSILSCCWSRYRRRRNRPKNMHVNPALYGPQGNQPPRWEQIPSRGDSYANPSPPGAGGYGQPSRNNSVHYSQSMRANNYPVPPLHRTTSGASAPQSPGARNSPHSPVAGGFPVPPPMAQQRSFGQQGQGRGRNRNSEMAIAQGYEYQPYQSPVRYA